MKYNPQIHHRRSIRLKGYDYSKAGAYFITICCEGRECRFGKIENDEMILNEFGTIAYKEWTKLPDRFPNFELDVFQIMPNHMHAIIVLTECPPVGAGFTPAQSICDQSTPTGFTPAYSIDDQSTDNPMDDIVQPNHIGQPQGLPLQNILDDNDGLTIKHVPTVGSIIGAYKSLLANECLKIHKKHWEALDPAHSVIPMMGKLWQRNYHEHIIVNEQSYQTISEYIINNPSKWKDDKFFMA